MKEYEPTQCDHMPIERRAEHLREFILPDIELSTDGIMTVQRLISAKKTLDIGCGSGAYVKALSGLGATGTFIGVDLHRYTGDNAYNNYDDLIIGDIRQEELLQQLGVHEFDTIISMGTPLQVVKFLRDHKQKLHMSTDGLLLIVTDDHTKAEDYPDFDVFHGTTQIDESILVFKQK